MYKNDIGNAQATDSVQPLFHRGQGQSPCNAMWGVSRSTSAQVAAFSCTPILSPSSATTAMLGPGLNPGTQEPSKTWRTYSGCSGLISFCGVVAGHWNEEPEQERCSGSAWCQQNRTSSEAGNESTLLISSSAQGRTKPVHAEKGGYAQLCSCCTGQK